MVRVTGRVKIRIRLRVQLVKVRVRVSPSLLNSCQGVSDDDCEGGTYYIHLCEVTPLTASLSLPLSLSLTQPSP